MELLKSAEANGLGLLISWAHRVVLLMVCKSSMVVCIATSTKIMLSDSAMVGLGIFEMVTSDGLVGSVMVNMAQ